jgi:hypothetical protein
MMTFVFPLSVSRTVTLLSPCGDGIAPYSALEFFGSLFYDAFSVTRLYSVDDRVTSE